jgi:hypothetical protein
MTAVEYALLNTLAAHLRTLGGTCRPVEQGTENSK